MLRVIAVFTAGGWMMDVESDCSVYSRGMDAFASVASRAHSIHKESKDDSKPRSRLRDLARKAHVHSTQELGYY